MQNTVTLILGKKGSGKSTLTREVVADAPRVLVIDPLFEYGEECGCRVVEEDDCIDAVVEASSRDVYRLSLRCRDDEDSLDLIELAFECPRSLVVVEEASIFANAHQNPEALKQLIRYGRHREIDMLFVARRPSELPRDFTSNADVLATFRQQEPRDLIYLRSFYGDAALSLPDLPDYRIAVFGDVKSAPTPILRRMAFERSYAVVEPDNTFSTNGEADEDEVLTDGEDEE